MALIACIPDLRKRFLTPTVVGIDSSQQRGKIEHLVFGSSPEDPGVTEVDSLRSFLLNCIDSGIALSERHAQTLLAISDPGQDQDDEVCAQLRRSESSTPYLRGFPAQMALVMLRALVEKGFVKCAGVVTNLRPARARARLARGTLDELGLATTPVAVGTDGGSEKHVDTFTETAGSYMPDDEGFDAPDGQDFLLQEV